MKKFNRPSVYSGKTYSTTDYWGENLRETPQTSTLIQVVFPWDPEKKEYTFRDWDESKVQGKVSKEEIQQLFDELKKLPHYEAEYNYDYWKWAWILILFPPLFGLVCLYEITNDWRRKNRDQFQRGLNIDAACERWNARFKESEQIAIFARGKCAAWLDLRLYFVMKTMTQSQLTQNQVHSNELNYSIDYQVLAIEAKQREANMRMQLATHQNGGYPQGPLLPNPGLVAQPAFPQANPLMPVTHQQKFQGLMIPN